MDAAIAPLFSASLQPNAVGGVALALAGLYAAWLWHEARRTARWLALTPKPSDAPRRRALYPCCPMRLPEIHFGMAAMLGAQFDAVVTANPTRRIEDKTAFLYRLASRSLVAAILLAAVATALLLAA